MWTSRQQWTDEERRKKAIHAIRQMMDSNVFDMPALLAILEDGHQENTN